MPVGVISSSASTTPMKPAATPSRSPAKITGAASGMITLATCCQRVPRNERHIWISDGLALRTAPNEFSTITGIARMQTAITFEVRPMP